MKKIKKPEIRLRNRDSFILDEVLAMVKERKKYLKERKKSK